MTDEYLRLGQEQLQQGNLQQAMDYFLSALQLQPDNAQVLFYIGLTHSKMGQAEEAIRYYRKSLELDPDAEGVWTNLGNKYDELKQYDLAEECYRKSSLIAPDNDDNYVEWGRMYQNQERYEEALAFYEEATRLNPDNEDAWDNQSDCLRHLDKWDQTAEVCEELVNRWPNEARYWSNGTVAYWYIDNYERMLVFARKTVELRPDSAQAHDLMGRALSGMGLDEEALAEFEKALQIDPDDDDLIDQMVHCLFRLQRYEESIKYGRPLAERMNDKICWNLCGRAHYNLGHLEEALECLEAALEIDPNYDIALSNLADVYSDQKEYDKAIELYLKVCELDPESHYDLNELAYCLIEQKRYQEAVSYLVGLLPHAEELEALVSARLGYCYQHLQQYDEAVKYYRMEMEQSHEEEDINQQLLHSIALCQKNAGRLEESENSWLELMALTEDPEAKAYCCAAIADICCDQGRFADALVMIRQAVKLDPEEEEYKTSRKRIRRMIIRNLLFSVLLYLKLMCTLDAMNRSLY